MQITSIQRGPEDAVDYPAGAVVFNVGDHAHQMYIVVSGEIEIRHRGRVLEVVEVGGVVGELALIDDGPRSAEAVARVDSKLAAISRDKFLALVQKTPDFALEVMALMAERLRRQTLPD